MIKLTSASNKGIIMRLMSFLLLLTLQSTFAAESLAPDTVKISNKVVAINREALRNVASQDNSTAKEEEIKLDENGDSVESPEAKFWFEP